MIFYREIRQTSETNHNFVRNEHFESIFLEEGNQVGEETGEMLVSWVAHLSINLTTKHVELMEELIKYLMRYH